jgi:hypothetical protein
MKKSAFLVSVIVAIGVATAYELMLKPAHPLKAASSTSSCNVYTLKRIPSSAVHHGHLGAPNMRLFDSTSVNCSGYAVPASSHQTFTDVNGYWIVPSVSGTATAGATYSSAWVGIDGDGTSTVEQLGTEQDWAGSAASYYAWYEMYPHFSYEIVGFPVKPGDHMYADVKYNGDKKKTFTFTLINVTQASTQPFSITLSSPTAKLGSAEWVMEAPYSGGVLPLANFGTIYFYGCYAKGQPMSYYANLGLDPMTMVGGTKGNVYSKAVPSSLDNKTDGFSVTWDYQ